MKESKLAIEAMKCPICNNDTFGQTNVLKQRLINEWGLNNNEVEYINRQQGLLCSNCSCNLRSMTLADSIMKYYSFRSTFDQFCNSNFGAHLRLLEVNTAGDLHPFLIKFKKHIFAEYPNVDLQNLPYPDDSFDLIIHSDTLEHVKSSTTALKECFRVLKEGGALFYTIPIVYSRLTKRRDSLLNSYHGSQDEFQGEDYKVWTEYGADFWVEIVNAGFTKIFLITLGDLSSIAICAKKEKVSDYRQSIYLTMLSHYKSIISKLRLVFL